MKKETSWPTAEEEKRRMFENARKAAQKTQQTVFEGHMPYDQGTGAGGDVGGAAHDKIGNDVPTFPQSGNGGNRDENGAFVGGWAMSPGGPYSNAPFAASQPTPYNEVRTNLCYVSFVFLSAVIVCPVRALASPA